MAESRVRACPSLRLAAWVLALPIAFGAAGCSSVRNARAAQDPASAVVGERTTTPEELGIPANGPIALAEVERAALAAHPSIAKARRDVEAANARAREVAGNRWPQISGNPAAQYKHQTTAGGGQSGTTSTNFQAFGFSVSWLVYDFGRTPALVRQAERQALAAQQNLRAAEIDALFKVRQAFFELKKQRELLKVADDTVHQFEVRLEQVRGFVEVGKRAPYDLTKAEVDLGNARLTRVKTADAVRSAGAALANAVGLAQVTEWEPAEPAELETYGAGFDQAWAYARQHEPRAASAAALEQGASALVDAQVAALYPAINFGASWNASGTAFPLVSNTSFGPSLSWLVFNGMTNQYTIDEAAANLRGARAQKAQVEQQVWLDVRSSFVALEDAKARVGLTALTVRSAEENLRLAQGRYEVGQASAVDLTDAQVGLAQARSDQAQARADYQTALAQLWKALGVPPGGAGARE